MFEQQNIFNYGTFQETLGNIRQEYLCPISREIMRNPVMDYEGISYQKENIQKWYEQNDISPVTKTNVLSKALIPNYYLQDLINKIEAQVPALCSLIQILKDQISQLKIQNEMLRKQIELDKVSSDEENLERADQCMQFFKVSQKPQKSQNSYKMMMLEQKEKKENQLLSRIQKCENMLNRKSTNSFQFIKSLSRQNTVKKNSSMPIINQHDEYEQQIQKQQKQGIKTNGCVLSKRKMIKKRKFQQHFDLSMEKLLKKSKKDWIEHLNNLIVQYTQAVSKNQQKLLSKEQSIKKFNETIKTQQVQIAQLNKMVQQSQYPEIKIFQKLQDLSAEFKTLLSTKNSTRDSPKDSIDKEMHELRQQNELMRKRLNAYQNEARHHESQNDNTYDEKTLTHVQFQPSELNQSMHLSQKYRLQLKKLQDEFRQYKQKKDQQTSKITSNYQSLATTHLKLQQELRLSTSQSQRLQKLLVQYHQQRNAIQSLEAQNQQLNNQLNQTAQMLKNTLKQFKENNIKTIESDSKYKKIQQKLQAKNQQLTNKLKKTVQTYKGKVKQLKQDNKKMNFLSQINQLQNQKSQLLKSLQQSHQKYQRASYQNSIQIKECKGQIKSLSEFMAVRHQMWMFLFYNIFATLDYCAKEDLQQGDQLDLIQKDIGQKKEDEALMNNTGMVIEKNQQQSIHNKNIEQSLLPVKIVLDSMVPENASQLQILKQQNSIEPSPEPNHKQQIKKKTQHQIHQSINQYVQKFDLFNQKNKHQKLSKYSQTVTKIKQTLDLYMWNLQINLKRHIKTYGEIYKNSPQQTLRFYQKIKIIYQVQYDKTAWNFWNFYKIYLNQTTYEQIGYQMNAVILLKILEKFRHKDTQWEEVVAISSRRQPICTMSWKTLVKYHHFYPNVSVINLENSKIEQVTHLELQNWKKLKYINFIGNPLSQTSINNLKKYAKKYPDVEVMFSKSFFLLSR